MARMHIHPAVGLAARLLVSVLLLALLMRGIDLDEVWRVCREVDIVFLVAAVFSLALSPLMSAPRWHAILHKMGQRVPFGPLTRSLYVGAFFSQLLPSTMGGDIWRIWACTRLGVPPATATYSIMIERLAGLSIAVGCFVVSFPWLIVRVTDHSIRWVLVVVLAASIGLVCTPMVLAAFASRLSEVRILAPLAEIGSAVAVATRSNPMLLLLLATGIAGWGIAVVAFYLLALGIGAPLSVLDCVMTLIPGLLIAMLPISFGGWGLREGALVTILKFYDVPSAQALALSVLFGFALLVSCLPGLFLWLRQSDAAGSPTA
jgi:uncharacterized protein (TIRG00374 family)